MPVLGGHVRTVTGGNVTGIPFSDESCYNLSHADGRARVYLRQGERFAPVCVRQYDRFGGGDVMVWAV